ncbi:PR domain zinc finger protein 5-like [Saccostrea echinata]|uniref:PR domain zinc finger protein 5-like n=1 Tax=Saccostrea echinata TaxID=191078 RepID=UPI002A822479|nr:PR domain zinc finger protein 5-like [Saccostrea echinata]
MTICGLANIEIDCDNKEISVFCKHELPNTGSKIIGAVSVLFVQQPVSATLRKNTQNAQQRSFQTGNCEEIHGSTGDTNKLKTLDQSLKLEVPSSLSVINLPFGESLEKHFSQTLLQNPEQNVEQRSSLKKEYQQKSSSKENNPKEETITAQKVVVDLSGEMNLPETVKNTSQSGTETSVQKHTKLKLPTSSSSTPSIHSIRTKPFHTQRPLKMPSSSQHSSKMIALSRPPVHPERFQANNRESSLIHNMPRPSQQRNSRSIIPRRRGFDLHCFVCHQVLETYRQVGEHCNLHNLKQQCPVCRAKFSATSNMKRHCLGHFSHACFPCSFCKATFRRKDNLRTHMLRHLHKNNKSKCTENTGNKSNHTEKSNSFANRDCVNELPGIQIGDEVERVESCEHGENAEFVNLPIKQENEEVRVLGLMEATETNENPNKVIQEQCTASKNANQYIENENQGKEERIVSYNCSSCGMKFSDLHSVRKHVIRHHAEQVSQFSTIEDDSSMYLSHDQSERYQAPEVDHSITGEHALSRETDSAKDNNLIMSGNKISFSNQDYNQSDVIDIENLSQVSNGDTSHSSVSLEQASFSGANHEIPSSSTPQSSGHSKGGMLGSPTLMCSICQQYLLTGEALVEHQSLHTNVMGRGLWCVVCGTRFSSKDCLRRHINNHLGTRFKCPLCSSVYSRKDNLKKHVKDVHHYHYDKNGIVRPLI